jgi:hypothetical protein
VSERIYGVRFTFSKNLAVHPSRRGREKVIGLTFDRHKAEVLADELRGQPQYKRGSVKVICYAAREIEFGMRADDAVAFGVANVELEGMEVDDELRALMRSVAAGETTVEDAMAKRRGLACSGCAIDPNHPGVHFWTAS